MCLANIDLTDPETTEEMKLFSGESLVEGLGFDLEPSTKTSAEQVVTDWIKRQQQLMFLPKLSTYKITIEKQEEQKFWCTVAIRVSSKKWIGSGFGVTPLKALLASMAELMPVVLARRQTDHFSGEWREPLAC